MLRFDSRPEDPPRLPGDDFDVPFEEAIAWARERKAVLPAEFYGARLQAVRARSFAIAGLSALDQVQQVADSLADATAKGTTLREWQRNLPDSVFELGKARRELIFRNAVQTHYGIGRTIQQRENAASRPYLMWDAINDSRTRPTHAAMDGHIAPINDPIWRRWSPPAGHNSLLPWQRVSGSAFVGLKARYAGPIVEIVGQSGARLSVTAQHPVLTRRGWVAAQDIEVGDQLVSYGGPVGSGAVSTDLDEHDAPPTIEEVFNALALRARGTMPRSALHLHGDAQFVDGNVEVVAVDRELMERLKSARTQGVDHFLLALADQVSGLAERACAPFVVAWRELRRCAAALGSIQPSGGGAAIDHGNATSLQVLRQALAVYAESALQVAQSRAVAVEVAHHVRDWRAETGGRAAHVAARDHRVGFRFGPLGDTAFADVFVGGFEVNPNALADALKAHPGAVEFEDVVDLRTRYWSGHVYDLETASGNILAYGNTGRRHYVVSNCRCTRIALSDAQARARGYPKADPGVEPDAGWAGDPTEGNADLLRIIEARRSDSLVIAEPAARSALDAASEALRRVE